MQVGSIKNIYSVVQPSPLSISITFYPPKHPLGRPEPRRYWPRDTVRWEGLEETLRPLHLRPLAAPCHRVWGLCLSGFCVHSSVPLGVAGWLGPHWGKNGSLHGLAHRPQSWRGGQWATRPKFIPLSPPGS